MKILNVFLEKNNGSLCELAIGYYSSLLHQLGVEVFAITSPNSNSLYDLIKLPIKIQTFKISLWNDFYIKKKLEKEIAEFNPDIIIVYGEYTYNLIANLTKSPILFFLSEKISKNISCDGVFYNNLLSWLENKEKILLKIPSRKYYNIFNFPKPRDTKIAYHYKQIDSYNKEKKSKNYKNELGCNSNTEIKLVASEKMDQIIKFGIRIDKYFDHDINLLLKSFSMVDRRFNNYEFIISTSDNNKDNLSSLIKIYRLTNHVRVITDYEFEELTNMVDVYLLCPYDDVNNYEVTYLINNQIATIKPRFDSSLDLMIHGINCFCYKKEDAQSLAQLIEKILLYPSYINKLYKYGKKNVDSEELKWLYSIIEDMAINESLFI